MSLILSKFQFVLNLIHLSIFQKHVKQSLISSFRSGFFKTYYYYEEKNEC